MSEHVTTKIEALFSPAEYERLKDRDLSRTVCVVFDVLRATSTMTVALANGARTILPVREISEALELRRKNPGTLLAGERHGLRITARESGSVDFDLGNSPREFTRERVVGRTIAMTTTNGTRALHACAGAQTVLIGAFLNLAAIRRSIRERQPENVLLICSGTGENASYEDAIGAGALCEGLSDFVPIEAWLDSAYICCELFRAAAADLPKAIRSSKNGRRLSQIPDLREDVGLCATVDLYDFVAGMDRDGRVAIM